jgi:glutamine synthetase
MGEYGEHQFEVSSPVREGLRAADEAVMVRETIRDAARATGLHATFAPKPDLGRVGNGVHIHMSLWDLDGRPATAEKGAPTQIASAFAAGVLKYLDAVMAYTTPSPNSFDRLRPSSWVGVFKCFGIRNREAAIRLAPRETGADGKHPSASLEFRVTDGAANPYLALAALVRAGLMGISEGLTVPEPVDRDPATIEPGEREARGIFPVVATLEEALAAAEPLAQQWFGSLFWRAFSSVRRNEIADAAASTDYPAQISKVV